MRRILIQLLLVILASSFAVAATNTVQVSVGTAASGGSGVVDNCPDATYDFAWTGENTAGAAYGCFDSGTSSATAASNDQIDLGSGYAQAGSYGALANSNQDDICWTISETSVVGTVWFSIYEDTPVVDTGYTITLIDSDNITEYAYLRLHNNGELRSYYNGQNVPGSTAISADTWTRVGFAYDVTSGVHSVYDGDWDGEDTETLTQISGDFTRICIGNSESNTTVTGAIWFDNIYLVNGTYQADDPMP